MSALSKCMNEHPDQGHDELARRQAAARRTAWILVAVVAAIFVLSIVQGYLAR